MSFLKLLRGFVPLIVILGIWEIVGSKSAFGSSAPAPSTWWGAFKTLEQQGEFWPALRNTVYLYLEGLTGAVFFGVTLGIALGAFSTLNRAVGGILEFARTTPAAAIIPAALIIFHAGPGTEIGLVIFGTIWPILLNTASARRALPPLRLDVARSMGIPWWERMRKFVLPSLLPEIVVGIRIAAALCLIITLLVDFLVDTGGLGFVLVQTQESLQAAESFALLCAVGILGVIINIVIGYGERAVLHRFPSGAPAVTQ